MIPMTLDAAVIFWGTIVSLPRRINSVPQLRLVKLISHITLFRHFSATWLHKSQYIP